MGKDWIFENGMATRELRWGESARRFEFGDSRTFSSDGVIGIALILSAFAHDGKLLMAKCLSWGEVVVVSYIIPLLVSRSAVKPLCGHNGF